MRWVVPIVLAVLAAGCTMPSTTTSRTETFHSEPPYPVPAHPPPAPYPGFHIPPPGRGTILVDGPPGPEAIAAPREIQYNGGFEEDDGGLPAGWMTHGDARRDTNATRTGAASLHLGPGARVTQTIGGAQAGHAAWLRFHTMGAPRAEGEEASVVRFAILSLDAELIELERMEAGVEGGPAAGWNDGNVGPFLFGNAASHLRIEIAVEGGAGAYVDDVALVLAQPHAESFANGGFESGPTGWALSSGSSIDCGFSFAPEGNCTLRFDHATGGAARQRLAPSGAGVSFSFTYASQVVTWSERWLYANMTFLDASGAPTRATHSFSTRMVEPAWRSHVTELLVVPQGTAIVELEFTANAADRGPTWIDDVRVAWS